MSSWLRWVATIALAVYHVGSHAALDIGDKAPPFMVQAAVAGTVFPYSLSDELKKGPVVLYFFPMAFSAHCSIEAHNFAEAIDQYHALGATVVGVSRDDIDTQKRFSISECRGKFPVASDADQKVMKAYDAVLTTRSDYANRVSYVISPAGEVIYQYTSLNPTKHVENTLKALKSWLKSSVAK